MGRSQGDVRLEISELLPVENIQMLLLSINALIMPPGKMFFAGENHNSTELKLSLR